MRARAWLACLALAAVAGCSNNDTNSPPQIVITAPADGDHLGAAANVVAEATDDEAVARVRFTLDDVVLLDDYAAPWQAAIPVGEWASGRPVVLGATVWDSDGIERSAAVVTITIDPALQTVPQLLAFGPAPTVDPPPLAAQWLRFPGATGYTMQLSRGAEFGTIFHEAAVADTQLTTVVAAEGVVYARVRAQTIGGPTGWSRARRFADVAALLTAVPLSGSQAGLDVTRRHPAGFSVVSGPSAGVAIGAVTPELIALDDAGVVTGRATLPSFVALWTVDPYLYFCGDDWVECRTAAEGTQVWRVQPGGMSPVAIGGGDNDLPVLVAGPDLADDAVPSIAILNLASDDGAELDRTVIDVDAGDVVTQVGNLAGTCVVAGTIASGGVWVRGVDTAQDRELWRLRLGTGDGLHLRDATAAGGSLVLVGDADEGGAWAASVAASGRLRWLVRETAWVELAAVAPAPDGGVVVTGHRLSGADGAEVVYGELSAAGAWRWRQSRAFTLNARGLGIAVAGDGSVVVVGTALPAGGDWDLLLLRSDDLGDLD
jgi:hypothetical protein